MKILFTDKANLDNPYNKLNKEEIITLINVYNKLCESINYYEAYLKMESDHFQLLDNN